MLMYEGTDVEYALAVAEGLADFLRRTGMTSFVEKRDDGCVVNGILITERE
jgi:hypothetical protein